MADYETEVLADSPTFVLPMDEASGNLTDIVAAKTATANGSPTYGLTGPVVGHTAIDFPASTTEFFTVADHADLDLGADNWTIEVWYAQDAGGGVWEVLVSKEGAAYFVTLNNDAFGYGRSDTGLFGRTVETVTADGSWHHYVVVRDAGASAPGDTRIYIDGALQTLQDETYATALGDSATALHIGKEVAGSPASGKIAYVALYKSALTEARIDAHFAAGPLAPAVNVIDYTRFPKYKGHGG